MTLSEPDFAAIVLEANLAPSVHNTQPTRWLRASETEVLVRDAAERHLAVGDPYGRDADVSHGAAVEGFVLACSARDIAANVDPSSDLIAGDVARITLSEGAAPDPLQPYVHVRRTYRGRFLPAAPNALDRLSEERDVVVVRAKDAIAHIAAVYDTASLSTFRDAAFRAELLSWMRLSRQDPRWTRDGLNAQAMEMSGFEAAGAGIVLRPGVFETLDRLGVASGFVAEARIVSSAAGILLFHRPADETPLETGRRYYRLWLSITKSGLSAAPMAVLADDPKAASEMARSFNLPQGRRLITALRVGRAPERTLPPKPRLPVADLIS